MKSTYLPLLLCCVVSAYSYKLTILHNNDFHSRFAETDVLGGICTESKKLRNECYAGVARTIFKVNEIKENSGHPVLFLNAGDNFQGTLWYTLYKHKIVAQFVNLMAFDAMSLGNHEFDEGVEGLAPFVEATPSIPIVAANLDLSKEPSLARIEKSIVLERGGVKIGIIGYLTPDTVYLASTGENIKFEDEIVAIRAEAKRLTEAGVKILIALGHSGFERDKEIAASLPELDIVIGGHTNTFLFTASESTPVPSTEKPADKYPVVFEHEGGSRTLYVQGFAFGKYLGKLDLEFDAEGNVQHFEGAPLLMDASVKQDGNSARLVQEYERDIGGRVKKTVGSTKVFLCGGWKSCRLEECTMGNVITDAYVYGFMDQSKWANGNKTGWTEYPIAVTSGGDVKSSIDVENNQGNITLADILLAVPYGNTLKVIVVSGRTLRGMFENSVANFNYHCEHFDGRFLQVSGIRVLYDITRPVGERVVRLRARCGHDCLTPTYFDVQDDKKYPLIVTDYLSKGGDCYSGACAPDVEVRDFETLDFDLVSKYIKARSPITTGREDRIEFNHGPFCNI